MSKENIYSKTKIDLYDRDEVVNNIVELIDGIFKATQSAFIMIDGTWGSGKTFVVDMLGEKIEQLTNYKIINFNCWENSYYNDPLEGILECIYEHIEKDQLIKAEEIKKLKHLINFAMAMMKYLIPNVSTFKEVIDTSLFNENVTLSSQVKEIREIINNDINQKIVILVDEIDRCLPEYGIKTLERLYLMFKDVLGIVVVIANNSSKMEQSIKNAFGYESIDDYMEKFIDFTIHLTNKDFSNKHKFEIRYQYYLEHFELNEDYWEFLHYIFDELSSREKDKLIKKAFNIHQISFNECGILPVYIMLCELIFVKYQGNTQSLLLKKNILENDTLKQEIKKRVPLYHEQYVSSWERLKKDIYFYVIGYLTEVTLRNSKIYESEYKFSVWCMNKDEYIDNRYVNNLIKFYEFSCALV